MENKQTDQIKPDTKKYAGPDLSFSAGSPKQHKTRITNRPHTIPEDKLPPGAVDIRQVKEDHS
ncbi:hypothetical protein ACFO25_17255 [Paenactinomyces guangxiensis]|uniref:Uncharacterized protein n=1 Tax=Paenactinomyces guangxiensis TaxID=1490290 RepID=A0A7W1WRL4_9BACL|nr:hypothetical protein [Paenactinomyces guangxiensis]MBA4494787.1 hypothetical protein [Paenactinomyces guangxiensis]MBH8591871.1 hypothetical protein [Paenactinomyces guangxiensis]